MLVFFVYTNSLLYWYYWKLKIFFQILLVDSSLRKMAVTLNINPVFPKTCFLHIDLKLRKKLNSINKM